MTEDTDALVPIPGSAMAMPADLAAAYAELAQTGEQLGGTLLDMLAIYKNSKGRWQAGEEKKDAIVGVYLHAFGALRSYWPDTGSDELTNDPPACWSLGGDDAVPSEECADPQHPTCEGCPWNEFGSKGKGKACKTKRADFIIEVDETKLVYNDEGLPVITPDAVLGPAMLRMSATAKPTRQSIGTWAKALRADTNGIPQLVLTKYTLVDTPGPRGDYSAPVLTSLGRYVADQDALEEILTYSQDFRDGQAAEIITTLAGRAELAAEEEEV